jgi:Uma2 family endonuclease
MQEYPDTIQRAVILSPPRSLLEERRRTGADLRDEIWEGILHMIPPPSTFHQRLSSKLHRVLAPLAEARGLEPYFETGLYRPNSPTLDYCVPDLMFARPAVISERGVEGRAELVIELLSRGDESHEKLDFYAQVGVSEALLIDSVTREAELYELRGSRLGLALPGDDGFVRVQALEVKLATAPGPKLALTWPGGCATL